MSTNQSQSRKGKQENKNDTMAAVRYPLCNLRDPRKKKEIKTLNFNGKTGFPDNLVNPFACRRGNHPLRQLFRFSSSACIMPHDEDDLKPALLPGFCLYYRFAVSAYTNSCRVSSTEMYRHLPVPCLLWNQKLAALTNRCRSTGVPTGGFLSSSILLYI